MAGIYNCQIGFWQRQFLRELFKVVLSLWGRGNFVNLALTCKPFGASSGRRSTGFGSNLVVCHLRRHPEELPVGVSDCSFLPKSGTETWGLDQFFFCR